MSTRLIRSLIAMCGILGTAALVVYFSAPFWLFTLPAANATDAQLLAFGTQNKGVLLLDTWLQAAGSLLSVIFALALVHLAGATQRLAGRLTLLVSGVILTLSLAEGGYALGALQGGMNGHLETVRAGIDFNSVFIHVFGLTPSLFLMLGFALLGTPLLPKVFSYLAITLGILFQMLGTAGLFSDAALLPFLIVVITQNVWTIAAAITLVVRSGKAAESRAQQGAGALAVSRQ